MTTDIYVPFQHCDAIRVLGLSANCGIDTVGADGSASAAPGPYLQEIRSAVRAMRNLEVAVRGT